jgi:hypothetical protein
MFILLLIKDRARFEIGKVEECLILAVAKLIAIIAAMIVIVFVMVMIVIIP